MSWNEKLFPKIFVFLVSGLGLKRFTHLQKRCWNVTDCHPSVMRTLQGWSSLYHSATIISHVMAHVTLDSNSSSLPCWTGVSFLASFDTNSSGKMYFYPELSVWRVEKCDATISRKESRELIRSNMELGLWEDACSAQLLKKKMEFSDSVKHIWKLT